MNIVTIPSVAGATLGDDPADAANERYPTPASTAAQTGAVSRREQEISVVSLRDLEGQAEKIMPPYGFAYVSGGAGDEWTMRENLAAFNRWVINPSILTGTETADPSTVLLGTRLSYPVITAPLGNQGCVHARQEAPAASGTALAGTIYVESSVSQMSLEEVAAASTGPKWFQIYIPESRPFATEMLERVKASGYTAVVVTVDTTVWSNRERSTRLAGAPMPRLAMGNAPRTPGVTGSAIAAKMDLGWDDIEFCAKTSGLPVIVKGILSAADARAAADHGCAGVWLSNHGGRQLDNVASALTCLPEVAEALGGKCAIIVDGGVFRGQDVFRALALGANAVAIGRPVLYGAALGGARGVQCVHDHLRKELTMVMRLAGVTAVSRISRSCIAPARPNS